MNEKITKEYLESNVSSTETDIYTRLAVAWTANDSLSVIWKLDLTDKMKRSARVDTAVCMHCMEANKMYGEKARQQLHKNAASNMEQILEATHHKAAAVRPPTTHYENYPS